MRNAFAQELHSLAAEREELVLLSGDIGNRLFNGFKEDYGERFFNCGVAEANMISVAAGMAMSGLRPVVYTIVPFVTLRCLEQIRVDVCYHRQPVVIVGVGGGFAYANLGATHHACEDVAAMRSLPGMQVICAADPAETRAALRAAFASDQPTYLRIGKKGEAAVHPGPLETFHFGAAIPLEMDSDHGEASLTLLANGTIASAALEAAKQLRGFGVSVDVLSCPSCKPLDQACLRRAFLKSRIVCTVEEHSCVGGFGAAVAEWLADQTEQPNASLIRIAAPDSFFCETGSPAYARRKLGLDADGIVKTICAHPQYQALGAKS